MCCVQGICGKCIMYNAVNFGIKNYRKRDHKNRLFLARIATNHVMSTIKRHFRISPKILECLSARASFPVYLQVSQFGEVCELILVFKVEPIVVQVSEITQNETE